MPWKESHVMDERLRFTTTPQPGKHTGTVSTFKPKAAKLTRARRRRSA
jgi:hypothetical protein